MTDDAKSVADWWETSIIDMEPGRISLRGVPIETLIGNVGFAEIVWRMLRDDHPTPAQAKLLEAAMVAAVDHGPQAPSVATARMAVTCGASLNQAMASAVNLLDDVHGGAGEQAVELFHLADTSSVARAIETWRANRGRYLPGFGHRFHTSHDPRAPRLLALVENAVKAGACDGRTSRIATDIEAELSRQAGKSIPMNIDGATAVILAELGFPAPLARGVFCLSRSVGIIAHAWEQMQQGGRNKGPTPPKYRWTYTGP